MTPTPTPIVHEVLPEDAYHSWTIYLQVYRSSRIVRASFSSAAAAAEREDSGPGIAPVYRPIHELRFQVHEYLKGAGPSQILVLVRGVHTYSDESSAIEVSSKGLSNRNTNWDGNQAILFLNETDYAPASSTGTVRAFKLSWAGEGWEERTQWNYTIDFPGSGGWMPAISSPASDSSQDSQATGTALFAAGSAVAPPSTVGLTELRASIARLQAPRPEGVSKSAYEKCAIGKLLYESNRTRNPSLVFSVHTDLLSGLVAGTEVFRDNFDHPNRDKDKYHLGGPHPNLFLPLVIEAAESYTGYNHILATARPLIAGQYRVFYYWQLYKDIPCSFYPKDQYTDIRVRVAAPAGTLHEAFFDPAAGDGTFGFSSSTGHLEPSMFSLGDKVVQIQALLWREGSVSLKLMPSAPLTDYALDFFALDGSVSLTLRAGDAALGINPGELSWAIERQPWQEGDLLMLRIRLSDATPATTPTPTPTPILRNYLKTREVEGERDNRDRLG